MHVVILFHNIGGYHAARLRAAYAVCSKQGWQFTAIQETDSAQEHPWGDLEKEITFPLRTLLPAKEAKRVSDLHPQSKVAAERLPKCLEQLNPDALVIPGWGYPISRSALKWAQRHHLLAILMSESKRNDEPRNWLKEKIKSLLYVRRFSSALVGGSLHHQYLTQLGFSQKAIFEGYDVVDNDYFAERANQARKHSQHVRQHHPQIPTRPYFIAVTRFIPRKNVLRLIEAFSQYRQLADGQAWDLVICGSGQEESKIRAQVQKHQLQDSVHLPGFQSYQAIPYWFGLASAFVHPALSEQWGLVVNEAMAAGLPILVSNRCGCYPELIQEGINGFGFDPSKQEQLTNLMVKISSGSVDLDLMGLKAFNHVQKFSPDNFAQGFKKAVDYARTHCN